MAVRNRILNSTTPFTGGHKEKAGSFGLNPGLAQNTGGQGKGFEEDPLSSKIPPHLCKVLTHGTAKHIGTGHLDLEKRSTFIAQAECEGQQEFSPSFHERTYISSSNSLINSRIAEEFNNVALREPPTVAPSSPLHCPPRRRKRQRRRKEEVKKGGRQRTLSGVPEQESSGPLQVTQEKAASCTRRSHGNGTSVVQNSRTHALGIQETAEPEWVGLDLLKPPYFPKAGLTWAPSSSTQPWGSAGLGALPSMPLYSQESGSESEPPVDCSLALQGLRGSVSQEERDFASAFYKQVEQEAKADAEGIPANWDINEGLLFHPEEKLQPNEYEYREERDYSLLNPIQRGAYGNVFRVRDKRTGFECAAKKVPLELFSSEEVGSWSALKSRRVVELFGVVREGPFVIFFMALKSGSVGQLLKQRGRLPQDLALHYHCQVLEGIEYLQRKRVVHLDIKADNVLLSDDGKDACLCDFGHSERLDPNAQHTRVSSGAELRGTESHMAPEAARGEALDSKADVWSSCCMLLHMLNGCTPWTRYYCSPLCLKVANEPPPLREIPGDCTSHTADVIKAGLVKDPIRRASARELGERAAKALKELGGLTSPVQGPYQEPEGPDLLENAPAAPRTIPSFLLTPGPAPFAETSAQEAPPPSTSREKVHEEASTEEHDNADTQLPPPGPLCIEPADAYRSNQADASLTVTERELQKLERDLCVSSLSQLYSPEFQEQLLSCLTSGYISHTETGDKDFARFSVSSSVDLSSGVFSYNSQTEGQSFSMDWLGRANPPTLHCFEGVDVYIEDLDGRCLKIRETQRKKVGSIATGISKQISVKAFSLETWDGRAVSHNDEVCDSGIHLRCTLAPHPGGHWRWRVKDGVLETRDKAAPPSSAATHPQSTVNPVRNIQ